jgi:ornithine cyclodeaminase/alanine dehydrogenase-like protein (mu-crystallin family)
MAIILTEKDLRPLYRNADAMDELLKLIEASLRAHNRDELAGQMRMETSLVDPKKKFRVTTAAVPGSGMAMRINALFRAKDGHFILLFDGKTGDLLALIDGRELNVWRTGAPAGVASRYLAPPGAKTLGLLGSGRQARGQLLAIRRALPALERVRVFSPTKEHRDRYAKEMTEWLGIDVEPVGLPETAVQGASIVSLATSSRSAIIEPEWIAPGALVISITSGQLPQKLIADSRVIVSWKEEVLGGDPPRQPYASMMAAGNWSADNITAELGEVILGKLPVPSNDSQIIIFESVGMPAWDSCAAAWAYRWALEQQADRSFTLD